MTDRKTDRCEAGVSNESATSLVTVPCDLFRESDASQLCWACIGPVMQRVRGKDQSVKLGVYRTLTPGQRALFSFWSLHGHAETRESFYSILLYLRDLGALPELESGALYFGLDELAQLYRECSAVVCPTLPDVALGEQLSAANTDELFERYRELSPAVLERIATFIRRNPQEFVRLTDS